VEISFDHSREERQAIHQKDQSLCTTSTAKDVNQFNQWINSYLDWHSRKQEAQLSPMDHKSTAR